MTGRTWAVSCYFNPLGYTRRLENYREFRRRLTVPLVTVELGYAGFELGEDDADFLVQLEGADLLWQKERLLNIALRGLPAECECVALLDADIAFADAGWPRRLEHVLARRPIAQLFGEVRFLGPDELPEAHRPAVRGLVSGGFVARMKDGSLPPEIFRRQGASQVLDYSPGFAWGARRDVLDEHGLYDAMILGGGDKVMAAAAYGRIEETVHAYAMNDAQARHYRAWARPFFARIRSDVGFIDETIFHLWHGRLRDRRYGDRYEGFERFDFDPYGDVHRDAGGPWRWNSAKPGLRRFIEEYFAGRMEDGSGEAASEARAV